MLYHPTLLITQARAKLEDCVAEAEVLKGTARHKQAELESAMQRQEQMLKAVTNAMNVEEQAKLTAQKQLRTAKDRAAKLDQELTDVMGRLADANERTRDMQAERDDALVRLCWFCPAVRQQLTHTHCGA